MHTGTISKSMMVVLLFAGFTQWTASAKPVVAECFSSAAAVREHYGEDAWPSYSRRVQGHKGRKCYFVEARAGGHTARHKASVAQAYTAAPPPAQIVSPIPSSAPPPASRAIARHQGWEPATEHPTITTQSESEMVWVSTNMFKGHKTNVISAQDVATFNSFRPYGVVLTLLPAWRDDIFIVQDHGGDGGMFWPLLR